MAMVNLKLLLAGLDRCALKQKCKPTLEIFTGSFICCFLDFLEKGKVGKLDKIKGSDKYVS